MLATFFDSLLATLFIIICILLIGVVLLQKGRGGGLSAAFGGMGSSAFGTRVGDVLTWVTIVMTALFLLLATAVTLSFKPTLDAVATPVFEPDPGVSVLNETVTVTLKCTDTGLGAKIYYTTDGKEPTVKSTLFEKPFKAKVGTPLRARAFLAGRSDSQIADATYTLNVVKPVTAETPATGPAASAPATAPAAPVKAASMPAAAVLPAPAPKPATAPAPAPAH